MNKILKDEPPYRARQAYRAVFVNLIGDWSEASELPAALRQRLADGCPLDIKGETFPSRDGKTVKAAVYFGRTPVETVLMEHGGGRNTVCVSSQIGCPLACDFCLTGSCGFTRNLKRHEIIDQVLFFARHLKKAGERITNVVFMGMGEPLLNYAEVLRAIGALNDKQLLNIGARKISVSTVGIIDGIKKLAREPLQINLAVSLHAPDDALRGRLMPVARENRLPALIAAMNYYLEKTGRRIMVEYLMLSGMNDGEKHALALVKLLANLKGPYFVNLISYNTNAKYKDSPASAKKRFRKILENNGIAVIERYRFGRDIKGGCGQLAAARR